MKRLSLYFDESNARKSNDFTYCTEFKISFAENFWHDAHDVLKQPLSPLDGALRVTCVKYEKQMNWHENVWPTKNQGALEKFYKGNLNIL